MNKFEYIFAEYGFLSGIVVICTGFFLGVMTNVGGNNLFYVLCGVGFIIMVLVGVYVHINEWEIDFYRLDSGRYVDKRKMSVRKAVDRSSKNGYVWRYHRDWIVLVNISLR